MPSETEGMETINDCLVSVMGGNIIVLNPSSQMSKSKALRMAAWIVALADPDNDEFSSVLNAVLKT